MKIHISYTAEDLQSHAAEVCRLATEIGWEVVDAPSCFRQVSDVMQDLQPRLQSVASCDALLVLSAYWYGKSGGESIQELEWKTALDKKKRTIALRVDPEAPWLPKLIQPGEGTRSALESFRKKLDGADERATFNADPLSTKSVAQALARVRTELGRLEGRAQRVFVVWDFTITGLDLMLTALRDRPPNGFEIEVPGLEDRGGGRGELLHDVLVPGIANSDKVLVVTDRPNANVAFEAGLATGFAKPIALVCFRSEIPEWLKQSAFKGYLVKTVSQVTELRELIQGQWKVPKAAQPAPGHGETMFLAPSSYVGAVLREEQSILKDYWRVLTSQVSLDQVHSEFSKVAQVVWTIASYGEGRDTRDGAENAANGLIAGWFYARAFHSFGKEAEKRLAVIRQQTAREVLDVAVVAKSFARMSEFVDHLKTVRDYRLPEPLQLETVSRGSIDYKMTKAPPLKGRHEDVWVGVHLVTNQQYRQFCCETGHPKPEHWKQGAVDEHHPVVNVSMNDAQSFCEWAELALPSLDQWLHFARAGSDGIYWWGDSEGLLSEVAWHRQNSDGHLHNVGQKKPNTWGLYDVLGNVWEWTQPRRVTREIPISRDQVVVSEVRVLGGAFDTAPTDLKSARVNPGERDLNIGFRCVKIDL